MEIMNDKNGLIAKCEKVLDRVDQVIKGSKADETTAFRLGIVAEIATLYIQIENMDIRLTLLEK